MINFKLLLGLYPSTKKIEAKEKKLFDELQRFELIHRSEELKKYYELNFFLKSAEYKAKKTEIKNLHYKNTEAYLKEIEYKRLKKSPRIQNYYKTINHPLFSHYLSIKDSDKLKLYYELNAFINQPSFKEKQNELKKLCYKNSDLYQIESNYNELKNSEYIKNYFKVINSKDYKNFVTIKDSDLLKRYEELHKIVNSAEFKTKKENILKDSFKNTEAYLKQKEYQQLKSSKNVKTYYKVIQSRAYNIYQNLNNTDKITNYRLLETYILSDDFLTLKKDKKTFKNTEAYQKNIEFNKLSKDKEVKTYLKFVASSEFKIFQQFTQSNDFNYFQQLDSYINSDEYRNLVEYYKISPKNRWKQTDENIWLTEYEKLKKNKSLNDYFKFLQSKKFQLYTMALEQGIIDQYKTLKEKVESAEFNDKKAYLLLPFDKKWKQTEEYAKYLTFKNLSKDPDIRNYLTFTSTNYFKIYEEVSQTNEIPYYEEIETYLRSKDFKEYKSYMLLPFKKKWEQTEEYIKEQEFKNLSKNKDIIWYLKIKDTHKFDEIRKWQLTFEDDFTLNQLDTKKWLTRYFYADNLLNDSYSLSEDKHFNTDGKNLRIADSKLIIETRQEKVTGKAWIPMIGFMPKEFDYTSGLLNTGKSFRQQYGRFRAKIRMCANNSVTSAFWMVGNQIIPHINIAKFNNNFLWLNNFWGNITETNGIKHKNKRLFCPKLSKKFFIYELVWTPHTLKWFINNVEIFSTTEGIPNEPMYINFSSGILNKIKDNRFPDTMEIDWVKCYALNENF